MDLRSPSIIFRCFHQKGDASLPIKQRKMADLCNDHDANGHHSHGAAAGRRRRRMDPLGETMKAGNTSAQRLQLQSSLSASNVDHTALLASDDYDGDDDCDSNDEMGASVGVPRIISYSHLQQNDEGCVPHVPSQPIITTNAPQNPNYGATSNGSGDIRQSVPHCPSHTRSKTVGDVPSSSLDGWRRRKESWFSGGGGGGGNYSEDAESSKRSVFGGSGGGMVPPIVAETIVYAPTDGPCPPQTPLLGSSKMVANVRSAEMRRQISRITWGGAVSVGDEDIAQQDDHSSSVGGAVSLVDAQYLEKVRSTFYQDAITFAEGTIPQSIAMAIVIGIVCGFVAYLYYLILFSLLDVIWKDLPNAIMGSSWPEGLYVLYIPLVTLSLSLCCGLFIYFLGEPGDLAFTIKCVHEKAYEGTSHILPMVLASLFTILAGASLGPEAPLVGICAATAGFVSRKQQRNRNVVRKHTLMGMAGALASFFGVPLGGSLFALEVTSRFSVEYFEHLIESIACGEVCVAVFRSLAQLPLGKIWDITPSRLESSDPILILIGAAIGLLGAGVATLFASFHWRLMSCFNRLGLLDDDNRYAVPRVLLAALAISLIGMLVPHTYFWGEFEFNTVATMAPASDLRHIWPTSGLIGFEMDSWAKCMVVGVCKIIAISFTVAGGYRGGFIFPFFCSRGCLWTRPCVRLSYLESCDFLSLLCSWYKCGHHPYSIGNRIDPFVLVRRNVLLACNPGSFYFKSIYHSILSIYSDSDSTI